MALKDSPLQDVLLQMPAPLRDRAEEMASLECVSLNLFVATAVAEKLLRLQLARSLGSSSEDYLPLSPAKPASSLLIH